MKKRPNKTTLVLVTRAELEQVVKEYKREGAPTCACWGCKFARRIAPRIGMKVETIKQYDARWAKIIARREKSKGKKP